MVVARAPGVRPAEAGRWLRRVSWALAALAAALGGSIGQLQVQPAAAAPLAASIVMAYDGSGTFLLQGRPTFPIGLSNPPPLGGRTPSGVDALAEVANAGVTLFRVGPLSAPWTSSSIALTEAWNRAALAHGARTWVSLGNLSTASPGSRADAVLQRVVATLLSDPSGAGIAMWKGADEPAWGGPTPSALRFVYCRVTSRGVPGWCAGESPLDPSHLWVTIEAPRTAAALSAYSAVTDTHGVDVYPVSATAAAPDLHQVGVWTRKLASITPDHSVWTTLQICDSGSYDRAGDYVLPTRAQERYMIYDAIINGARGLAFFGGDNPHCWDLTDKTYGWSWSFWKNTLMGLVQEINARSPLGPALVAASSTRPLATNDPSTEVVSRIAVTNTGTQLWILAARNGNGTRPVTITGLPTQISWGNVYTENRSVAAHNGALVDRFGHWQVHVYSFTLKHPAAAQRDHRNPQVTGTSEARGDRVNRGSFEMSQ